MDINNIFIVLVDISRDTRVINAHQISLLHAEKINLTNTIIFGK